MKSRWLLIVACVLVSACNSKPVVEKPDDNSAPPSTTSMTANADSSNEGVTPDTTQKSEMQDKDAVKEKSADQQADKNQETDANTNDQVAEKSPAEDAFETVVGKHRAKMAEFSKAYSAAETDEERQTIFEEQYPKGADFADDMFAVADEFKDSPVAFKALSWIANNADGKKQDKAFEIILNSHLENKGVKELAERLGYGMAGPKNESRLATILEKSPHDEVKATATISLARLLGSLEQMKDFMEENADFRASLDEETITYLENAKPDPARIEALYEKAAAEFGDVTVRGNQTIAEVAERSLFELRNLAVGKVAPEIEGDDLDGVAFKLSDYRGKVVVIDFWGDW